MNSLFIAVPGALQLWAPLPTVRSIAITSLWPGDLVHESARKLALTFDDGPNPAITPKLLDLLDRFEAKLLFS